MGGGISASSVNRLRKTILIRAYNLRQKDETLDEQFRCHSTRSSTSSSGKVSMLMLPDVKKVLQLEDGALWASIEELLCHCAGNQVRAEGIAYDVFIDFLESGKIPPSKLPPPDGAPDDAVVTAAPPPFQASQQQALPHPPSPAKPSLRVSTAATSDASPTSSSSSKQDHDEDAADRPTPLPSPHPYVVEPADSPASRGGGSSSSSSSGPVFFNDSHDQRHRDAGTLVTVRSSSSTGALHAHSGKPLWKKKETTKMERMVEYTTIDADGVLQVRPDLMHQGLYPAVYIAAISCGPRRPAGARWPAFPPTSSATPLSPDPIPPPHPSPRSW